MNLLFGKLSKDAQRVKSTLTEANLVSAEFSIAGIGNQLFFRTGKHKCYIILMKRSLPHISRDYYAISACSVPTGTCVPYKGSVIKDIYKIPLDDSEAKYLYNIGESAYNKVSSKAVDIPEEENPLDKYLEDL